jgi:sugar phosphate isomerase/epimerase
MTVNAKPLIGACLPVRALRGHLDWLLDEQRDLEIQSFHEGSVLNGDWRSLVAEARDLLQDHRGRLGIHGPFRGFSIATQDEDVRAVVAKRMDQALDVAAALGATQVVIHSPFTTWDANNLDKEVAGREGVIGCVHACIGPAVKRAEALGVTFVIENIEDKNPADRRALAESFCSPAVKLSVDTGHAYYAHASTGAPPVDYFVLAAEGMLDHVHLQDADGHADRHWRPGVGTMRWEALFDALARIGGAPRLVLEMRDPADVLPGWTWLEALGVAR